MALHRLVFDITDADTIAASANVGAYLRSADGTLLTHTDVGGKKALDVRVAEGINVEVDLDAADDSVASWTNDGAGNPIGSTGGALHISDAGGSLTVDAVDLDIRNLVFATDKVDVTGSSVTATQGTSPWVVGDGGGSLTVDAVDLDIRNLLHTQDSVRLGDGTDFYTSTTIGPDIGLDVNVIGGTITASDAALANTAVSNEANSVTTVEENLVTTGLANRKYLFTYNHGSKASFIGTTGVTSANGFPIFPGTGYEFRAGPAIVLRTITDSGTTDMRNLQFS